MNLRVVAGAKVVAMLWLAVTVASCGGGGGSTAVGSGSTGQGSVSVSGRVTYTDFEVGAAGILYNAPTERPIRGGVVEIQSPPGTVLQSVNSSDNGEYTFSQVPANTPIRILVKAALGAPGAPNTRVVDNTNGGALYAVADDSTTGSGDTVINLNAGSGFTGTGYTGVRAAGPFAILDVIYQGQQLIRSEDAAVNFPSLTVNWSPQNRPSQTFNPAIGDIGTSSYRPNQRALFILGAANLDTDEYDSSVIAHEWGHYFEDNFSATDSPGGSHGQGDILHPSLAFGEGYGYALGGIITNDPSIVDTVGFRQASASVRNLERDSVPDNAVHPVSTQTRLDGYYSETSVQELLYDLYDAGPNDDDPIALGFGPIYRTLIGGQRSTPAFTSIFSFMHHLKRLVPAQAGAIDALALQENINLAGNSEFQDVNEPIYADIGPASGTLLAQTSQVFGPITAQDAGNKLLNRRFFRFTAPTAGCFSINAAPVNPANADVIVFAKGNLGLNQNGGGGAERATERLAAGAVIVFSVGAFSPDVTFSVAVAQEPNSAC